MNPDKIKETKKTVVNTTDWSNIPYYPTTREKRENVAKYLAKMGKAVPVQLLKQIEEDKKKEVEEDIYNINNSEQVSNSFHQNQQIYRQPIYQNYIQNNNISKIPVNMQKQQPPHIFSPQYASYIGIKPRAQTSARVHLGGVY